MKPFRSTAAGITAKFDHTDARLLANLATQVAGMLAERDELSGDPAIERLLPDAYRGTAEYAEEYAAEFRRFTEDELADDKIRSALGIAELLSPDTGSEESGVRVVLDKAAALDWLRSLTDIRLALASRLGIVDDTSEIHIDDESRYTLTIYNWLGQLQYSLVRAVDR